MSTKRSTELAEVARRLFRDIDAASGRSALVALGERLEPVQHEMDSVLDGLGFELFLWIGLKIDKDQDGGSMADDYRRGILKRYAHVLKN